MFSRHIAYAISPSYFSTDSAAAGRTDYPPPSQTMSTDALPDPFWNFEFIIFKVENVLFRVPKYEFQAQSEFFRGMFTLPPPPGEKQDGLSEEQPLVLENIKSQDFRQLLRVLYPRNGEIVPHTELSSNDWASVLSLSDMLDFPAVRELALNKLDKSLLAEPIKRYVLGKKFDREDWQLSALTTLVTREQPVSVSEAQQLGWDVYVKLAEYRERCQVVPWTRKYSSTAPVPWEFKDRRGEVNGVYLEAALISGFNLRNSINSRAGEEVAFEGEIY